MFRNRIALGVLVVSAAVGLAVNTALAQHHEGHQHLDPKVKGAAPQLPKCPVMDDPVDLSIKTMTPDGPVYFCCKDCIKKFEAGPTKYAKQVIEQRKALAKLPKLQVTCPVSGKPVDEKAFIEKDGQKLFFCCKNCIERYEDKPAKYAAALADSYSYQTKCPVMNEDIDPKAFIKLNTGQTIYFCCDGCDKKFLKDPGKYAPKLDAQGIHIDPKKAEVASTSESKDKHEDKGRAHEGHGDHEHDHGGHDH